MKKEKLKIAQISDSHLFADRAGLHHGDNVYQNLLKCLVLVKRLEPDIIIFTGDLTQDHSETSYQNFANAITSTHLKAPLYYLAGNHDEHTLLDKYLSGKGFSSNKLIDWNTWQILLVNSKSETPAGYINEQELLKLKSNCEDNKSQLLFMHHHPVDVDYFIDRHGLKNQDAFWHVVNEIPSIKAIACGHIHNDLVIRKERLTLYTCPATSIQFAPDPNTLINANRSAGFRTFELLSSGEITSQTHFV